MKTSRTSVLIGLPLIVALGAWLLRSPDEGAHEPPLRVASKAPVAPPSRPSAEPPVAKRPAPAPSAAPAVTDPKHGDVRAILAEGEANRVAAREARYAKLDWDAPRPGPPPPGKPVVGKREAALSAIDKLEQTEQMISLLEQRIAHTRARANAGDARLLERLEKRVVELDQTAQLLRQEHEASGSVPSDGDTDSSVPEGSGDDPHG